MIYCVVHVSCLPLRLVLFLGKFVQPTSDLYNPAKQGMRREKETTRSRGCVLASSNRKRTLMHQNKWFGLYGI